MRVVQVLLVRGAGVNVLSAYDNGKGPLYVASQNGHLSVVQCLLDGGAVIDLCDAGGTTPLWIACQQGHLSVAQYLIEGGADCHAQSAVGGSPLHCASYGGHTSVVALLLRSGSCVDVVDMERGFTALMVACVSGMHGIVSILLAAGASVNVRGQSGLSAIDIAHDVGHGAICTMLTDAGSPVVRAYLTFRFTCHKVGCPNSEQSQMRLFIKCPRCRAVRYCSAICASVDGTRHWVHCHVPSMDAI